MGIYSRSCLTITIQISTISVPFILHFSSLPPLSFSFPVRLQRFTIRLFIGFVWLGFCYFWEWVRNLNVYVSSTNEKKERGRKIRVSATEEKAKRTKRPNEWMEVSVDSRGSIRWAKKKQLTLTQRLRNVRRENSVSVSSIRQRVHYTWGLATSRQSSYSFLCARSHCSSFDSIYWHWVAKPTKLEASCFFHPAFECVHML